MNPRRYNSCGLGEGRNKECIQKMQRAVVSFYALVAPA